MKNFTLDRHIILSALVFSMLLFGPGKVASQGGPSISVNWDFFPYQNFDEPPSVAAVNCMSKTSSINLLRHSGLTTVYLVRHAEKDMESTAPEPPGPELTVEGHARAEALSRELIYAPLAGIIVNQTIRTQQTAAPTEIRTGLVADEIPYSPNPTSIWMHILNNYDGQSVLVIGHTNTIPAIAERLGVPPSVIAAMPEFPIAENDYDNLFIIHMPIGGGGIASIAHRTYGDPSP